MTYADVDIKRNIIHVRGAAVIDKDSRLVHKTENKNASSTRDIPIMIPRLVELVQAGKGKPTDYLVTAYPNSIYKEVNAICEKHGLPCVGVHGLRHSFVSLAYHLGWPELATMQIAGYSDPSTMKKIYTHLAESDKSKNVNAMSQFFKL
jgi:integrase